MQDLGDQTHLVTMTACRLVQRMKKDWIAFGRRPHGLGGACLLIAARMHGFRRSQQQMAQIVRITAHTLSKRLTEFSETPTASFTLEEFNDDTVQIEEEFDPPSYRRLRAAEKLEIGIFLSLCIIECRKACK